MLLFSGLKLPAPATAEARAGAVPFSDHRKHPPTRPKTPPITRETFQNLRPFHAAQTWQHRRDRRLVTRDRRRDPTAAGQSFPREDDDGSDESSPPPPIFRSLPPRRPAVAGFAQTVQRRDVLDAAPRRRHGPAAAEAAEAARLRGRAPRRSEIGGHRRSRVRYVAEFDIEHALLR